LLASACSSLNCTDALLHCVTLHYRAQSKRRCFTFTFTSTSRDRPETRNCTETTSACFTGMRTVQSWANFTYLREYGEHLTSPQWLLRESYSWS